MVMHDRRQPVVLIIGTRPEGIIAGIKVALQNRIIGFSQSVHDDGYAADKIVGIIQARYEQDQWHWQSIVKRPKTVGKT
ncbi:MAG: hypothetical protein Q8Q25_03325, partial [bacterium]|nr:hypothetical protein [bacterium]